MSKKIITAIYDKKSKTIGKPIYQRNIEEAIQGIKDALNTQNQQGDFIMQQQREHPEDYTLIQIGWIDDCAKEYYEFTEKNGKLETKTVSTPDNTWLKIEEKVIIEFEDIELKPAKNMVTIEAMTNYIEKQFEELKEVIKNERKSVVETDIHTSGSNSGSRWSIFRNVKK